MATNRKRKRKHGSGRRESETEPIALDGDWGWVILVASFFSSVIVDGVCFTFGIFYMEFLDHFQESKGKTAWIGSVLNGMYMVMGPVAGALVNKFGCRVVSLVGSVWAATAFFLSTWSPNVDILILTYGVLGGMGFGLMYLPSIVIVGFYFDKKRALATGIATCGSGIGGFMFAPLCKALIDAYAWQGAQWILAGLVLNGVILAALYRPLTERDLEKHRRRWREKHFRRRNQTAAAETGDAEVVMATSDSDGSGESDSDSDAAEGTGRGEDTLATNGTVAMATTEHGSNSTSPDKPLLHVSDNKGVGTLRHRAFDTNSLKVVDSWHSLTGLASASVGDIRKACREEELATRRSQKPCSALHSEMSMQASRSTGVGVLKDLLKSIRDTMDVSMLRDPVFVIYGVSCMLCMAGFFIPFIYLPDKTMELGYDKQHATFLLSILGITNTVGRVIAGWVSDRPWADCLVINNCALVIGGVATALCPLCNSYTLLALYASVFGLCISAFVSLRSIILVDLIGIEKLTSAFGIIVLCQGISSFVGAPIAGFISDATGSYNVAFYISGTTIALAGAICFPLRRLAKIRSEKAAKEATADSSLQSFTMGVVDGGGTEIRSQNAGKEVTADHSRQSLTIDVDGGKA